MESDLYKRFNDPTRVILFLLVAVGLLANWTYAQRTPGADYYVAWTVADATRNDRGFHIYDKEDRRRMGQQYRDSAMVEGPLSRRSAFAKIPLFIATGTPFLYSTVNMVSTGNYQLSLKIWNALSLIGFSAAILLTSNLLGLSKTVGLTIFLSCLFWMNAFHADLRMGNTNGIQLGLLALAYYLLSRGAKTVYLISAGALIAMIGFFKPNLAPLALLMLGAWLIRGQKREFLIGMLGMAAGALVAIVTSSLFFGDAGIWLQWLEKLFRLTNAQMPPSEGNYNLPRSFGLKLGAPGQIAVAMVGCALTLVFLWWGRKADRRQYEPAPEATRERELIENAQLIGMACLVHMIASPLVWLHYYELAIPMIIVAFRPWSRAPAHGVLAVIFHRLLPALILLAFLDGPHWTLIYDDGRAVHEIPYVTSVIVLFLLGLWQLRFQDGRLPQAEVGRVHHQGHQCVGP